MNLCSPPIHSIGCSSYLQNHGIITVSSPDRRSCRITQTNAVRRNHQIQLQVRFKKLENHSKVNAKLQGDSELNYQNSGEDSAQSEKSEGPPSPQNKATVSADSSSQLEHRSYFAAFQRHEFPPNFVDYKAYLDKLKAIFLHLLASEQWNASLLKACHRTYSGGATNLIHYLALHSIEVHQLKQELSSMGILNLESINSHVLASIGACIQLLERLPHDTLNNKRNMGHMDNEGHADQDSEFIKDISMNAMRKMQFLHTKALFGSVQDKKDGHIMVTVGREVISNEMLLEDLLKAGADIIRINCAHDDPDTWSEIIRYAKQSSQMLEKPCRILMDLAGPKLRTGKLESGPCVLKISPKKNARGETNFPAEVWLSHSGCQPPAHIRPDAVLFVEGGQFFQELEVGMVLKFVDERGRKRSLKLTKKFSVFNGYGYIAECSQTAYVGLSTKLHIEGKKKKASCGQVVDVPPTEQFIRLRVGDLLTIYRDPSLFGDESIGGRIGAPKITCSSGYLFDSVKPEEPIAFDDGKIWGVIRGVSINEIVVSITHASPKGSKLGSEKSINIPKSAIKFKGLTSKDLVDLEFVAANADMVGISFIRDVDDMCIILHELKRQNFQDLGIVLKIETRTAFENLPLLLLEAMQLPNPLGVMIARGDLAVECEWHQLASIQEQILSICSAAHVPVIWATQVLDSLTKSGIPTRAEITDVASGMRASCIMLNKGKYIVEAVSTLSSILCSCSSVKKLSRLFL